MQIDDYEDGGRLVISIGANRKTGLMFYDKAGKRRAGMVVNSEGASMLSSGR